MLLTKTYLAPSTIEGMGLFAGEDIKKGTITWKFTPGFDAIYSEEEVEGMPPLLQQFIKKYAALSPVIGKYVLTNDNGRFTNHSTDPNLEAVESDDEVGQIARAKKDIRKGEELTLDYRTIDKIDAESGEGYLNK